VTSPFSDSRHCPIWGSMRIALWSIVAILANTLCHAADQQIDIAGLAVLEVQVGRAMTLTNVVKRFGPADIWHTGDASDSEYKVCYRVKTDSGEQVVVFGSSGEMASLKGQINAIRLLPGGSLSEAACPAIAKPVKVLASRNGLRIGIRDSEALRILGQQDVLPNGVLEYSLCKVKRMVSGTAEYKRWVGMSGCFEDPTKPYFNDCGAVQIRFNDGKAIEVNLAANQNVC